MASLELIRLDVWGWAIERYKQKSIGNGILCCEVYQMYKLIKYIQV